MAAALLDGVAGIVAIVPGIVLMFTGVASAQALDRPAGSDFNMALGISVLGISVLGLLFYQLRLLAREGQTIGKKLLHIRIVTYEDDSLPGAGRAIWRRLILNGVLSNVIPFYALVDILFIFGAERRCLHDYIAGTKVVEAG